MLCVSILPPSPHLIYIGVVHLHSAMNSARRLLELTLAYNDEMTCGRWALDKPTYGRPTIGVWPFGPNLGLDTARWALISCMDARASLKAVWELWWACGSS